MKTYEVQSEHGYILINEKGEILKYEPNNPKEKSYVNFITRFDLEEYRKYWQVQELPEVGFDILDLGFWYFSPLTSLDLEDEYADPDYYWRQEYSINTRFHNINQ